MDKELEALKTVIKSAPGYFSREKLACLYLEKAIVPRLNDVMKKWCSEIEQEHLLGSGEKCRVIHYTSIAALVSMLQVSSSQDKDGIKEPSLRLYDSMHFNDPDEGKYFIRNLTLDDQYNWLRNDKKEEFSSNAYIASFIRHCNENEKMEDNLVFWRTYGKEGTGCSLSFEVQSDQLRKVYYGSEHLKDVTKQLIPILSILEPLLDVRSGSRVKVKQIQETISKNIWNALRRISYLYKSEEYQYEKECRFIISERDVEPLKKEVFFELNRQGYNVEHIRHYCEDNALRSGEILVTGSIVTLGPRVIPHMKYCLEILQKKANLLGPNIEFSSVSYQKY